jgi:hypothetical protein
MNANAPGPPNGPNVNWRVSSIFVGGAQVHNFGAVACMGRACTVSVPAFELPDSGLPGAPWRWTARGIGGRSGSGDGRASGRAREGSAQGGRAQRDSRMARSTAAFRFSSSASWAAISARTRRTCSSRPARRVSSSANLHGINVEDLADLAPVALVRSRLAGFPEVPRLRAYADLMCGVRLVPALAFSQST